MSLFRVFFLFLSFLVLLPPVKNPRSGGNEGMKNQGRCCRELFFFKGKKKSEEKLNILNLTEGSVCILPFEVQSFNCALCKTHQAESHYYNINILLKKTYKRRWMEILWRSASYFDPKLWCERGLGSPCANQPFWSHFWFSLQSHQNSCKVVWEENSVFL